MTPLVHPALLLAAAAARASGAVADTAPDALAARVAGCYVLAPGAWERDSVLSVPSPVAEAPRRFRLTGARDPAWPEVADGRGTTIYRVEAEPAPGMPAGSARMFSTWESIGRGDTVLVSSQLPVAGVGLRVAPDGPDLAGWIYTFTDAIDPSRPSWVERAVRARRVACPAGGG